MIQVIEEFVQKRTDYINRNKIGYEGHMHPSRIYNEILDVSETEEEQT
jgi:hypothetical protein